MNIDIDKILKDITIIGEKAYVDIFLGGLEIEKEKVEEILDQLETGNLSVWDGSDEVDVLQNDLRKKIIEVLQEKGFSVKSLAISSGAEEYYVNQYPKFLEWEVIDTLNRPLVEMYYNKEDIEWMRKLLNTSFDLPEEEKLRIYREWNEYWDKRRTL